jgi:acyl-coenzyme A synthetase/AMP-(fatty) acid ligase
LEDAQAGLILTDSRNASVARDLAGDRLHVVDVEATTSGYGTENLGLETSPDQLSSIDYTSGSTGRPKGVIYTHRHQLHRMLSSNVRLGLGIGDRMLNAGSSGGDDLRVLLNGACALYWNVKEVGLTYLASWMLANEITIYHSIPTVFRHFVATLTGSESFQNLRLISLRGEPVYGNDVALFKRYFPDTCVLVNQLGITETGTFCQYRLDKATPSSGNIVPVGYAVEDKEILLFDEHGKQVGPSQVGEIAVKSKYISLGYWRKPDLTRARFISDSTDPNTRIYHTGDLGRLLPDGCLLHLGRKDFQVKIRGNRIEIAEIEDRLLDLDCVKETVVVAKEGPARDRRLVAYVVPATVAIPTVTQLRCSLVGVLPDYMIPSAFVILDALPLLPNGKVDRQSLPTPDRVRPVLDASFVTPRTPIETQLVTIWADVLDLDQVGIHDNFLELGGNSLLATRVVARVIRVFRVDLPIRVLLESPTVATMAEAIVLHQVAQADSGTVNRLLMEVDALMDGDA